MVFYGGLIFGVLSALAYARLARLELGNLLDVFAPGLALGLALGRVGCFMAGCCWGDLCVSPDELSPPEISQLRWQLQTLPFLSTPGFPLAVRFPPGAGAFEQHHKLGLIGDQAQSSRPVHPVQLYEAALALGLCLFLNRSFRRRVWPGQIFCMLILYYAIIRFVIEFLRADNPPIYAGLTLSQVIGLGLGLAAALILRRQRGRPRRSIRRRDLSRSEESVPTPKPCFQRLTASALPLPRYP